MHSVCKFVPSSKLSTVELDKVLTPDECLGPLSRARNTADILKQLPKSLADQLPLSAKRTPQSLTSALRTELVKGRWIAVSTFVRKVPLTEAQLQAFPVLKAYMMPQIAPEKVKVHKASYQQVLDDVPLARNLTFVAPEPSPDDKIVVEFAGQWSGNAACLMLSKTEQQREKVTSARPDFEHAHRSLATFKDLESEPKTLYIKIPCQGQLQPILLKLAEGLMPVSQDTQMPEWDNVLIPVRPLYYATEDKQSEKLADAKRGYIYVFWKKTLWRELAVAINGYFSDIDVEYFRAKPALEDKQMRQQEGYPLDYIWLPYKLAGEAQIEDNGFGLLYSATQLSWEIIEKLESDAEFYQSEVTSLDEWTSYSDSQSFDDQKHIVDIHIPNLSSDITKSFVPNLDNAQSSFNSQQTTKTAVARLPHNNGGLGIILKDQFDRPYAKLTFLIEADGKKIRRKSDERGFISLAEFYDLEHVLIGMKAHEKDNDYSDRILVRIGALKPIEEQEGQLQRLQNHDYSEFDLTKAEPEEVKKAISRLQSDYSLDVTGQFDADTIEQLSALDKSKNGGW